MSCRRVEPLMAISAAQHAQLKFLKKIQNFYFMCLFDSMHVCALCVCLQRPEKGIINEIRIKDGCESLSGCWKLNPRPLQ